jgi:hypothetical protein
MARKSLNPEQSDMAGSIPERIAPLPAPAPERPGLPPGICR